MKMRFHFVAVLLIALTAMAIAQTVPAQNNGPAPTPPGGVVSIMKPASGAKIKQTFVTVTYALTNPAASASGSPNYELRLDSQDPLTTTSTSHTFTGLTPGAHTVTVQLVDANGTPVSGGKAVVNFTVVRNAAMLRRGIPSIATALRLNPAEIRVENQSQPEPQTSAALPLISIIGFGVLLGGIASAMKSR
jgi:hypothetical protein